METSKLAQNLPPDFWLKTGIFVGIIIAIIVLVKIYHRSNKMVLWICITMGLGILFFSWVYNRNEPKFLTPVIDRIAVFFPTKDFERFEAGDPKKQTPPKKK